MSIKEKAAILLLFVIRIAAFLFVWYQMPVLFYRSEYLICVSRIDIPGKYHNTGLGATRRFPCRRSGSIPEAIVLFGYPAPVFLRPDNFGPAVEARGVVFKIAHILNKVQVG